MRPVSSTPDAKSLVFYFGSGAAGSRAPQGEFDPTAGSVDGGAVFGYGAAQNEPGLRRIAEQLGVPYVDRDDGRPLAESTPDSGSVTAAAGAATPSGVADRTELYWVFTLLAAVLILFELFAGIRDLRRTRSARRDVDAVKARAQTVAVVVASPAGAVLGARDAGRAARRRQDDFGCRRRQFGRHELLATATPRR